MSNVRWYIGSLARLFCRLPTIGNARTREVRVERADLVEEQHGSTTIVSSSDSQADIKAAFERKSVEGPEPPAGGLVAHEFTPTLEPAAQAEADEKAAAEKAEADKAEAVKQARGSGRQNASQLALAAEQRQNELIRERTIAHQERDEARTKNKELEAALEAAKGAAPAPVTEPEPPQKPTWTAFEGDGKSFEEFLDAHDTWNRTQWSAEMKTQIETSQKAATEAREKADKDRSDATAQAAEEAGYNERYAAAQRAHDDFDTVMEAQRDLSLPKGLQDLIYRAPFGPELAYQLVKDTSLIEVYSNLTVSDPMFRVIQRLDDGLNIMNHLRDHPDVALKISKLQPGPTLLEMGRLAERVGIAAPAPTATVAAETPAPGALPQTPKPTPITPVEVGPIATTVPLEKMPLYAYMETRNKQERERSGRM